MEKRSGTRASIEPRYGPQREHPPALFGDTRGREGGGTMVATKVAKTIVLVVIEGSAVGTVTEVPLAHGAIVLSTVGIPTVTFSRFLAVAVAAFVDGAPTGVPLTLTLEARLPGESAFADVASFTVNT